jgi:hypothetical protein
MLDELVRRVSAHAPREPGRPTDRRFPEAAVLLPITRNEAPELVLTLRASGLSTHGASRWRSSAPGVSTSKTSKADSSSTAWRAPAPWRWAITTRW